MATIAWYGWATSSISGGAAGHGGTAWSVALPLSSASCISFGSGSRAQFQQNITISTWNTSMHWAKNTSAASEDYCGGNTRNHFMAVRPSAVATFGAGAGRATACWLCTGPGNTQVYRKMVAGSPLYHHGLSVYFTHVVPVFVNPAYLWAGTNAAVDGYLYNCQIAMADLTAAAPTWATICPSTKLTLRSHASTARVDHQWWFFISVRPDAVGMNNVNKLKTQITYY